MMVALGLAGFPQAHMTPFNRRRTRW